MFAKVIGVAFLIFVLAVQASAQTPQVQPEEETQGATEPKESATQDEKEAQPPSISKPKPSPQNNENVSEEDGNNTAEEVTNNWISFWGGDLTFSEFINALLATALVFITLGLAIFTFKLWSEAAGQSKQSVKSVEAMERIAGNIEKSVKAAEESVNVIRERTAAQMRAYLMVVVGTAQYQGQKEGWRFKSIPVLINRGQTPAHNVGYRAASDILPNPLPKDFDFPLPKEVTGAAVIGPHGYLITGSYAPKIVPEEEIDDIKAGRGKALYTWGEVIYLDGFGDKQTTEFCHRYLWDGEQVIGEHTNRHNKAT